MAQPLGSGLEGGLGGLPHAQGGDLEPVVQGLRGPDEDDHAVSAHHARHDGADDAQDEAAVLERHGHRHDPRPEAALEEVEERAGIPDKIRESICIPSLVLHG